jgi:microcystin-dependent protein
MSSPYIGEIRMFAGSFAPAGWALCAGQLMPISENDALFTLLGTMYGGDGQETFGIPDLRGRVPMHNGQGPGISQNYQMGEMAGVENVTLATQHMPVHNHPVFGSKSIANTNAPLDKVPATTTGTTIFPYGTDQPTTNLNPAASLAPVGGNQPHENMQPFLCINFIISLFGIFPTQT